MRKKRIGYLIGDKGLKIPIHGIKTYRKGKPLLKRNEPSKSNQKKKTKKGLE